MLQIKHVPNLLSVLRIVASLFLILLNKQPIFSICYLLCGITDVLDGFIARRYQVQSALGAKLDSLGDFAFWLVVLILLYIRTNIYTVWVLTGIGLVAVIRLVNFIITKVKFHQWGMLHSLGNKITGVVSFLFMLYNVYF